MFASIPIYMGLLWIHGQYSTTTFSQINNIVNENGRTLDLCFVTKQDNASIILLVNNVFKLLICHDVRHR